MTNDVLWQSLLARVCREKDHSNFATTAESDKSSAELSHQDPYWRQNKTCPQSCRIDTAIFANQVGFHVTKEMKLWGLNR